VERFYRPYKHFSILKNLKLSLSRFCKIENACYNQFTIEWDAKASKNLTIAFFYRNTERWPVYFRPGAMFGIFVLIRKNRTGTTRGNGSPAYVAVRVKIPKSRPCTHHLPKAKYAAGAAHRVQSIYWAHGSEIWPYSCWSVGLTPNGHPVRWIGRPSLGVPPNRLSERGKYNKKVSFLEKGSLKETKGNHQKR
jgi:hypothetical protein